MSRHKATETVITIPGSTHGFTSLDLPMRVYVYDANAPTKTTEIDASALAVNPVTHDVTFILATGETLTAAPPEERGTPSLLRLTPEQMNP